jgi:hypothetical protein
LLLIYRLAVNIDLYGCDDDAEESEAAAWCWNVLAALGFVEKGEGKHGRFKPTRRLERLVKEKIEKISALPRSNCQVA